MYLLFTCFIKNLKASYFRLTTFVSTTNMAVVLDGGVGGVTKRAPPEKKKILIPNSPHHTPEKKLKPAFCRALYRPQLESHQ